MHNDMDELKQGINQKFKAVMAGIALVMLCTAPVQADDTEIFIKNVKTSSNANIVFVLDSSGSMKDPPKNGDQTKSKIQIVKDVFHDLIFDPKGNGQPNPKYKNLNLALMRFDKGNEASNNSNGGYFITAMNKLNGQKANNYWEAVNGIQADGWTPLAETAYEAFLYFNGATPKFGSTSNPATNDTGILNGTVYKKPEQKKNQNGNSQCELENHLVILTDGLPTKDSDADSLITGITGTDCDFDNGENCLVDLASYMNSPPDDSGHEQVTTHTIAFDLGDGTSASAEEQWLKSVSDAGGGMAINSNSHEKLISGIEDILKDVIDSARTSVSPATSLSSANNYVHDNTLYYALYQPTMTPKWKGNLKGYKMGQDGVLYDFSDPAKKVVATEDQIVGDVSVKAGEIMPDVSSKWSTVDGNKTELGGVAGEVSLVRDKVWAQTANNSTSLEAFNKTNISAADLNVKNDTERNALVDWALGKSETDSTTLRLDLLGDPLHSPPQVVNYGGTVGPVGFFATNEGFLHAFQLEPVAKEMFSFMPYALLPNLTKFKDPESTTDPHPYGLDGYISVLVRDNNGDGKLVKTSEENSDKVIVVVGMRRGGNNFYALDVTDPSAPALLWEVSGGATGFEKLGQSWSRPVISKMYKPNTTDIVDVVLFTGGYDPGYDNTESVKYPAPGNPIGNAIYVVDLNNGSLIWSSDNDSTLAGQMKHATPAGLTAVDVTQDGVVDVAYAIDILGNIFRVDFNTTNYVPKGQKIADLVEEGKNRRFYNAINVAYSFNGVRPVFHLNVGSGFRAHPLDLDAADLFYSVKDIHVFEPLPTDFTAIKASDLQDKSTPNDTANDKGWFFSLDFSDKGEKVLSKATTRGGYVFFTSYVPPQDQVESCNPPLGTSFVYAVNLNNGDGLQTDRHITIQATGIAPAPMFLTLHQDPDPDNPPTTEDPFTSNDSRTFVIVGTEKVEFEDEEKARSILDRVAEKIYWTQE
jgi:type IV pilus assembly protein PilY1